MFVRLLVIRFISRRIPSFSMLFGVGWFDVTFSTEILGFYFVERFISFYRVYLLRTECSKDSQK